MLSRRIARKQGGGIIEPIANWDFVEQTGFICTNKAGSNNDMTNRRETSWSTEEGRTAVLTSSLYNWSSAENIPPIDLGGELSMCCWARKISTLPGNGEYHNIFVKGGTFSPDTITLQVYNHGTNGSHRPTFRVKNNDVTSSVATVNGYDDGDLFRNTWIHICGTIDANTQKIYINGVEEGSMDTVVLPRAFSSKWYLGNWEGTEPTQAPWDGFVTDVRIYPGALSAEQVAAIAAGTD